jgi:ligand-binding sensor domain-containing protein
MAGHQTITKIASEKTELSLSMRYGTLIILLFIFQNLPAQPHSNYSFRHIDQTDGLLHNEVIGIRQDAKGFIWILSLNGLQRYDGTRFINHQRIVNNSVNGITGISELYSDNQRNELWVLKKNAIDKLNVADNRFSNYTVEQVLKDPAFTFDTFTNEYNNRCLLGEKGVFVLPAVGNTVNSYALNIHPLTQHESNILATDSLNNQTWFIGGNGLFLFDGKTRKIYSGTYNPIQHPLLQLFASKNIRPRVIMTDSRSGIWIATWGSLFYRFNPQTRTLSSYNLRSIKERGNTGKKLDATLLVNTMYEDNHTNIWIATENAGLLLYHKEMDDFENIIIDNKNAQHVDYNFKILCITQDREDNIWLGTDKGISIFNPYRRFFRSVKHERNIPSLPKSEILDFIQTNTGNILVGTWGGGIAVYDAQWRFKKNILFSSPHQYNMVWSFVRHDDGTIWAGCQHGYLHMYNPATEIIKTIRPPELAGSTIRCMAKDAKGNIWLGLHNGKITQWNKAQNKFYPYNDSLQTSISNSAPVFKIFIDKTQHFWVSTENGFKEFDPVKRIYTQVFLVNKNEPDAISGITSQGIEACNDTTLLIGTRHGGLSFFNTITKQFSQDSSQEVLYTASVYAIKKDAQGYIWFTTDYGLYKYKPENKAFIQYNVEPGIMNAAFSAIGFYSLQDGTWLTASATELINFQPNAGMQNSSNEKVEITGFKIFDNSFFIDSLLYQHKPVVLSYKQNFLTIEFALLNFYNLQQTKYYYRLSNVNNDWVSADTKKIASYTNLKPGEYIFSVKTENGTGERPPTSFTIIISPPFWQTWWFRSMIASCALLLIYGVVKWREKNIKVIETEKLKVQQLNAERYKSKLEMEQIINKARLEALRAQMNPHFIFNCLNSIDNLIQMDEKEKATVYLSKFAKLLRFILENAANDVVACWKDMETLQLYLELEALRFDNKFSYQVNITNEIMNGDYKVPPLVIQPFVENAIHHGLLNKIEDDKKLVVDVAIIHNYIHYSIEDNGVGRTKAAWYKDLNKQVYGSKGMQITTDRINLFNQHNNGSVKITDLYDEHGNPVGTKVEVNLINQS